MTDKEKAIVTAYTGIAMLAGDKFDIFHQYIEEKMGRPIWTHELAFKEVWAEIKEATREDFIRLCLETSSEAIPIEWLLKERDKNKEIFEKLSKEDLDIDFISKYGCNRASHKVLMIEELLLDWRNWEKENDR